jgi:hypothetical protein
MKYDDRPMYEQNKINTVNERLGKIVRPCLDFWKGSSVQPASAPSQLLLWWQRESRLRDKNEKNEIDLAEIKAALKSFKNRWTRCVGENRKFFEDLCQGRFNDDWKKVLLFLKE